MTASIISIHSLPHDDFADAWRSIKMDGAIKGRAQRRSCWFVIQVGAGFTSS